MLFVGNFKEQCPVKTQKQGWKGGLGAEVLTISQKDLNLIPSTRVKLG